MNNIKTTTVMIGDKPVKVITPEEGEKLVKKIMKQYAGALEALKNR